METIDVGVVLLSGGKLDEVDGVDDGRDDVGDDDARRKSVVNSDRAANWLVCRLLCGSAFFRMAGTRLP